jgi:hypothetical protein
MSNSFMKSAVSRLALIAVLFVTPAVLIAPPLASATGLLCTASVNNARPTDYSSVTVTIFSREGARVTATAHYKTTNTVKTGVTGSTGTAIVVYRISRATVGYRVFITVVAKMGKSSGSCRTSFTPVK